MAEKNTCLINWDWKAVSALIALLALLLSIGVYLAKAHAAYNDDQEQTASKMSNMEARICVLESVAKRTEKLPEQVAQQTVILHSIQGTLERWENHVFTPRR